MKIFDLGKTDKPRYYESRVSSVSVDKKAKINSQSQNTHNNISRPLLMEFDDKFYHILGRIPPLLSEAKVGDECRIFYLNY